MKNLVLVFIFILVATLKGYSSEPIKNVKETTKVTAEDVVFGNYADNIKFISKISKSNTLMFKATTKRAYDMLSEFKIMKYNKGYINNVTIIIKYKNKKRKFKF